MTSVIMVLEFVGFSVQYPCINFFLYAFLLSRKICAFAFIKQVVVVFLQDFKDWIEWRTVFCIKRRASDNQFTDPINNRVWQLRKDAQNYISRVELWAAASDDVDEMWCRMSKRRPCSCSARCRLLRPERKVPWSGEFRRPLFAILRGFLPWQGRSRWCGRVRLC